MIVIVFTAMTKDQVWQGGVDKALICLTFERTCTNIIHQFTNSKLFFQLYLELIL
jgi:hypothetical protein